MILRVVEKRATRGRPFLLPDTHTHIEAPVFDGDRNEVLARADAARVGPILVVGSDLASSRRAVLLAQDYEQVFAAVGIHPHEAAHFGSEAEEVQELLDCDKVVAIGEIGLDYHRDSVSRELQMTAFEEQLHWAERRGLPVSVHNRNAEEDILQCLQEFGSRVVLHCYTGSREFAERALARGMYLSFAGNITFPRAEELREVASAVPLERILVESDSPVLSPQPWRGRRNEPAHVVVVAEQIAALHGASPQNIAEVVSQNANGVFGWGAA